MRYEAIQGPDWLTRSAIYQINPRTFSAEGTIAAATRRLPELKELGFGVMYLCPVFEEDTSEDRTFWSERQKKYQTENPKNPYRMNDYFRIDSEYGTLEDLQAFIQESHRLGLKVLLDLVYVHMGPNAPILQRHPEFVQRDKHGNLICGEWHFPYLDFNCPGLREYLWCNMTWYIGWMDADGFRCDCGDLEPIDFWEEGRRRMKAIKPDSVLINEGRDGNSLVRAYDSIYSFDWHERLYEVITGKRPASILPVSWQTWEDQFPAGSMALRDLDNHDTVTDWPERAEVAAGHDGMELVQVLNYMINGIPMVYCGNEVADTCRINMFANRFHMGSYEITDWTQGETPAGQRRQALYRKLNAMKRESDVLRYGETQWLEHDQPDTVLVFRRSWQGKTITFAANVGTEPVTVSLRLPGSECLSSGAARTETSLLLQPKGYLVTEE